MFNSDLKHKNYTFQLENSRTYKNQNYFTPNRIEYIHRIKTDRIFDHLSDKLIEQYYGFKEHPDLNNYELDQLIGRISDEPFQSYYCEDEGFGADDVETFDYIEMNNYNRRTTPHSITDEDCFKILENINDKKNKN